MYLSEKIALYEYCRKEYSQAFHNLKTAWKEKVKAAFFRRTVRVRKKKA